MAKLKTHEPPPDPAKILIRTEVGPIEGFNIWSECTVPINVVLMREAYGDGHQDQWALMDTRPIRDPVKPKEEYGLRVAIEERHRILKCFALLPSSSPTDIALTYFGGSGASS